MNDDIDVSMPFTGPDDMTPPILRPLPRRPRGRWWKALLIAVVGLGSAAGLVYFVASFFPFDSWGDEVTVGPVTVHHARGVPAETAERLARHLFDQGIGTVEPADARLRRDGGGWVVDLFIPHTPDTDAEEFSAFLEQLHRDIARVALGGEPLVLRACDPHVFTNKLRQRGEPKPWKEIGR